MPLNADQQLADRCPVCNSVFKEETSAMGGTNGDPMPVVPVHPSPARQVRAAVPV
jgi:hypothetical protein